MSKPIAILSVIAAVGTSAPRAAWTAEPTTRARFRAAPGQFKAAAGKVVRAPGFLWKRHRASMNVRRVLKKYDKGQIEGKELGQFRKDRRDKLGARDRGCEAAGAARLSAMSGLCSSFFGVILPHAAAEGALAATLIMATAAGLYGVGGVALAGVAAHKVRQRNRRFDRLHTELLGKLEQTDDYRNASPQDQVTVKTHDFLVEQTTAMRDQWKAKNRSYETTRSNLATAEDNAGPNTRWFHAWRHRRHLNKVKKYEDRLEKIRWAEGVLKDLGADL